MKNIYKKKNLIVWINQISQPQTILSQSSVEMKLSFSQKYFTQKVIQFLRNFFMILLEKLLTTPNNKSVFEVCFHTSYRWFAMLQNQFNSTKIQSNELVKKRITCTRDVSYREANLNYRIKFQPWQIHKKLFIENILETLENVNLGYKPTIKIWW